jgi:hypothetical protein
MKGRKRPDSHDAVSKASVLSSQTMGFAWARSWHATAAHLAEQLPKDSTPRQKLPNSLNQ